MIYQKIGKYVSKALKLGPRKTAQLMLNKAQHAVYQKFKRSRAKAHKVSWDWQSIAAHHKYDQPFEFFFEIVRARISLAEDQIIPFDLKNETIIEQAQEFANNTFDLLGSGKQTFAHIPWHQDFRCAKTSPQCSNSFPLDYYKDIQISVGQTDQLEKDIKVPWELSRFAHLLILGKAYQLTDDEQFAQAFQVQIEDWLDKNPLLLGPNWVCPMDVAIRAVNWIWAFYYFKDASSISIEFWQRFFCSLYDHFDYLEHHWEIYDLRTSNHYFSDLIGYYYLCYFFRSLCLTILAKASWCHDALKGEFEKQVFDEGTDYEGSTAYHGLITEIVHHYFLISNLFSFEITKHEKDKFERMIEFMQWCSISNDQMIKIGDDDSGRILYFGIDHLIKKNHNTIFGRKNYKQFGLSIFKNDRFHVSLRHHAYQSFQPSGHHHNDVGSLTLAVDGIPVFVDPGSFVYTPSAYWRNQFRSTKMHNTIYLDNKEPVPLDDRLFTLDLPEKAMSEVKKEPENILTTSIDLYRNALLNRSIEIMEDSIIITDSCIINDDAHYKTMHWNFVLHPHIEVQQEENTILLLHNDKQLLELKSKFEFIISDSFYSSRYGIKVPCKKLKAQTNSHIETVITISL